MPNETAIRAWVDELRKGDTPQAIGALRVGDARCCLGVACDVYRREKGRGEWVQAGEGDGVQAFEVGGETVSDVLPSSVAGWLGLHDNPEVRSAPYGYNALGYLNDDMRLTFADLADAIERTYLAGGAP